MMTMPNNGGHSKPSSLLGDMLDKRRENATIFDKDSCYSLPEVTYAQQGQPHVPALSVAALLPHFDSAHLRLLLSFRTR